jgi:hypothetical protein
MARVVVTVGYIIPAGAGYPAQSVPKGACIEVTSAMAAAIASAGGTTRAVSTTGMRDQLGESAAASNASP